MKSIKLSGTILVIVLLFAACKKEGPEGPAGVPGPPGPTGNANIRSYIFKTATSTTGKFTYTIPNITKSFVDSCFIAPGFQVSSVWYGVPSLGVNAAYDTRYFLKEDNPNTNTYKLNVFLYIPRTTTPYMQPVTWDRFRIILAPATVITIIN